MVSINWVSPAAEGIGNALGYSHHNRKMLEHTSKLMDTADIFSDIALQIIPADQFVPIKGKINVLFTMFEMLDIPDSYKEKLKQADAIIVPCKFCKEIFRPHTKAPIYIVGEGIEPEDYPYYQRHAPEHSKGEKFRIYWSGAPNPRKGYQYALELIRYVEKMPNVELYIKTTFPKLNPVDMIESAKKILTASNLSDKARKHFEEIANGEHLEAAEKQYANSGTIQTKGQFNNIIFDTRRVPYEELRELYNKAHVFIFPSMGEGWGLMGTEAMATGCPVIAPRVTGIAEYFDSSVGYTLKTNIIEQKLSNYNLTARSYAPDLQDFIDTTFYVMNNYQEALVKGRRASKRIHKDFIWSKKAELLKSVLEVINDNHKRLCDS